MIFSDSSYSEIPVSSTDGMVLTANGEVVEITLYLNKLSQISLFME